MSFLFYFQLATFALLVIGFMFFLCEGCIVESCLPEFKGTYDEAQDELLAVDYDVG